MQARSFLLPRESRRRLEVKYEQIFEKQLKRGRAKSKRSSHLRRRGGDLRMVTMSDMVRPGGQIVFLLEVLHDGLHVPVLASVHWKLRHL